MSGIEQSRPDGDQPDGDPRFTLGLSLDVAGVLADHGYPPVTAGRDLTELQMHLLHYLHGRDRGHARCHGGAR